MGRFPVMLPQIFHAATMGYIIFILCYWMQMNIPSDMKVNMPNLRTNWWQYLTVWNMGFQVIYFVICCVDDLLRSTKSYKALVDVKERLVEARDALFQSLTLPVSMCVFTIFWVLYAYDRELVYPAGVDAFVPFWYNHLLHTAIVFFPWAEMLICQRPYVQCKLCYFIGIAVMGVYNVILVASSYWQGYWTYPLFALMTPVQKTFFFALMYSIYTTAYIIGYKANVKICGKISSDSDKSSIIEQRISNSSSSSHH